MIIRGFVVIITITTFFLLAVGAHAQGRPGKPMQLCTGVCKQAAAKTAKQKSHTSADNLGW